MRKSKETLSRNNELSLHQHSPKLQALLDLFYKLFFAYSRVVLLILVAIVTAQIVCRSLRTSLVWSEETALLLMVWMVFLSASIGVHDDTHIRIMLVYNLLPKRICKLLDILSDLVILIIGVLFVRYGWDLVQLTMRSTLPTTKLPSGIFYLMIPVSGVYIVVESAYRIFLRMSGREI